MKIEFVFNKRGTKTDYLVFITLLIAIAYIFLTFNIAKDYATVKLYMEPEIKDSKEVRQIADYIDKECKDELKQHSEYQRYRKSFYSWCINAEVESFILNNITLKDDNWLEDVFMLNNSINHTLKYGGDCENQAILALDILKALNQTNLYFVLQEPVGNYTSYHVCWMAYYDGYPSFYNCGSLSEGLRVTSVHRVA